MEDSKGRMCDEAQNDVEFNQKGSNQSLSAVDSLLGTGFLLYLCITTSSALRIIIGVTTLHPSNDRDYDGSVGQEFGLPKRHQRTAPNQIGLSFAALRSGCAGEPQLLRGFSA